MATYIFPIVDRCQLQPRTMNCPPLSWRKTKSSKSNVIRSGMSVRSPLMKLRLKFEPPVFLLSKRDSLKSIVALVEDQDDIGQEQDQVHKALQYVGSFGVEVHDRHQQCDQQQMGLRIIQPQLHPRPGLDLRPHPGQARTVECSVSRSPSTTFTAPWPSARAL